MKRALWALVIAVPLVIVLAAGFGRDPNATTSPLLNQPAPAFALQSLDGKSVSLAHLRGRTVVVNFWASWCLSCKAEHAYLHDIWRMYAHKGVTFLGITYHDDAAAARAFLKKYGKSWPNLHDPDHVTAVDYGVSGVPETFVIDRRGVIRYKSTGPVAPGAPMSPDSLASDLGSLLRSNA